MRRIDDLFGHQATPKARRGRRTGKSEHPIFSEWWASYPRRVARLDSDAAYAEAIEGGASSGELLIGLPAPTTYIERRFTDDHHHYPRGGARLYASDESLCEKPPRSRAGTAGGN